MQNLELLVVGDLCLNKVPIKLGWAKLGDKPPKNSLGIFCPPRKPETMTLFVC